MGQLSKIKVNTGKFKVKKIRIIDLNLKQNGGQYVCSWGNTVRGKWLALVSFPSGYKGDLYLYVREPCFSALQDGGISVKLRVDIQTKDKAKYFYNIFEVNNNNIASKNAYNDDDHR